MAFPTPKRNDVRIEMSPLIDVVFQLLIFFVVTTTFVTDTGIPLDLPAAASGQEESMQEDLSVRVSSDGAITFKGDAMSLTDLETQMQEALARSPDGAVTIYGDGQVDYETIVQVLDVARRADAKKIVLATEEPPASGS